MKNAVTLSVEDAEGAQVDKAAPERRAAVVSARWISIHAAADVLGMTPGALRKIFERKARKAHDGIVEADVNGVRARKLGRLWRVTLSAAWTAPQFTVPHRPKLGVSSSSSQSLRDDREGDRS